MYFLRADKKIDYKQRERKCLIVEKAERKDFKKDSCRRKYLPFAKDPLASFLFNMLLPNQGSLCCKPKGIHFEKLIML